MLITIMRTFSTSKTTRILALAILCVATLWGCGKKKNKGDLDNIRAYNSATPYAEKIVNCVKAVDETKSCSVAALPPIAMSTPYPTVDDIMDRLAVSHEWMGVRFEELLHHLPEDMLTLFGAVTAVVIDDDIRPSYYWSNTGAIYLDPDNLWLTLAEKSVISTKPDHRAAYADPMNFRSFWRTTINGQDTYKHSGPAGSRAMNDIIIPMASLLFHELAHANDILPPSLYANVDLNKSIAEVTGGLYANYPSTRLTKDHPLTSDTLYHLAEVLYLGVNPSAQDKAITASQVGAAFEPDSANDDYAYTSQYEDFAMLFEEAMMKIYFDVDRDTAFVTAPSDNTSCDAYKIGWGVRNRIGEDRVKIRAEQVIKAMLPDSDYADELASLPQPTALTPGMGWCESLTSNPTQLSKPGGNPLPERVVRPDQFQRLYDPLL